MLYGIVLNVKSLSSFSHADLSTLNSNTYPYSLFLQHIFFSRFEHKVEYFVL